MIMDALISLVSLPIGWVVALLPAWTLTPGGDYTYWVKGLQFLNLLLPITEITVCFNVYLGLTIGMFTWKWAVKLCDWIADVIP